MNIFHHIAFSIVLAALKEAVNDPKLKSHIKPVVLKVFAVVKSLFEGDPDFAK